MRDREGIVALANAVQGGYQRFRTFPANEPGRFILEQSRLSRHAPYRPPPRV